MQVQRAICRFATSLECGLPISEGTINDHYMLDSQHAHLLGSLNAIGSIILGLDGSRAGWKLGVGGGGLRAYIFVG